MLILHRDKAFAQAESCIMMIHRSGRAPGTWEFWKIDKPHGYNTLRYVYARWNRPRGLAYFNVFFCYFCYYSCPFDLGWIGAARR